jgi:PAS domain S-box-containing protein
MTKKKAVLKALLISKSKKDIRLFEQTLGPENIPLDLIKAEGSKPALTILLQEKIDIIFVDFGKSKTNLNFLKELVKRNTIAPAIALIEKGEELMAAEAIKEGAYDYIIKDSKYSDSLLSSYKKIRRTLSVIGKSDEEQYRHSLLFKQIYKSHKWWQNIIDSITDYLFVIDSRYRILRTNKAFSDLFSKEPADIIMKPYYELFGMNKPHEWCVLSKKGDELAPSTIERNINESIYLISYFPISHDKHRAVVYILKDITETRRLKDQIYHLDKLSSLGTLTSGVAHEINNPLTGIIGYTEMLLMKKPDETMSKYLRNIYDSALRCKRIVENMLTFSRQNSAIKNPENINDIIDRTVELHEYWLKSTNIEIVKKYEKVPFISVDQQQIQQIMLNLIINAEQAIAETDRRGRIEFSTSFRKKSKSILIKVSDNGNGIPQDILPKIFDPFFTTKPVNKGTGLGLSIAHGIIAEQGGTIEAKSESGKGTSFTIKFPVIS